MEFFVIRALTDAIVMLEVVQEQLMLLIELNVFILGTLLRNGVVF
jgi:hypothetical protein